MTRPLPSPLPWLDRTLLGVVARVVPGGERVEWMRTWQSELWHVHHRGMYRRVRHLGHTADLLAGLLRDAVWLRTDLWRRIFTGTATLCLACLAGLCAVSGLMGLVLPGDWHALGRALRPELLRTMLAVPLVVFVTFATASRRHLDGGVSSRKMHWVRRQMFLAAKLSLVLALAFLLSTDVCGPLHVRIPATADILQIFFFVLFALVGLRWGFGDQQQRCKQCLMTLETPARVGRPSHNLLEWNGTELACKRGHGLLSVPEMETSWCQASEWVEQGSGWDGAASV